MESTSSRPLVKWILIPTAIILLTAAGFFLSKTFLATSVRSRRVITWIRNPFSNPDWSMKSLTRCNPTSPFLFPTDGYVGFLWDDSFQPGHHHQGIDIFASGESGISPVYAVYDGYLTRLPGWKSSLIIRIPSDPLQPVRQIWTYYTHLADTNGNSYILEKFPQGTSESFISEGTFLGYQGNYSGTPGHPVGVHLHFSIVLDDGEGNFLNELKIQNTLDPSPYFDLPLNGGINRDQIPVCPP
jgi:murein DD-endopeptidase MepM/ murein hydrolase activator NlpD